MIIRAIENYLTHDHAKFKRHQRHNKHKELKMILENACEYKDYLGSVFDAMGFNGSFEVVDNAIHLNIIPSENQETPTKDQVLEKLKEITLETKKQELEAKINAICKEKIIKGFISEALGNPHAYDLTLEDQANLQALVIAGIDSVFRCTEVLNGVIGDKTYKKHTKAQILQLSKDALNFKQKLIIFYGREKERLNAITSLEAIKTEKQQATSEIKEAKETAFNELLETLKPKFSGLFVGAYYIRNNIYVSGGWEQKVKDLSDYVLEKSKKYEIEVFFSFLSVKIVEKDPYFGLKTNEGFLKESIQKITHKYVSQIYYKKLLVENVSGVLGLYHGYFYGNINYFNEVIITIISTKRALKGL